MAWRPGVSEKLDYYVYLLADPRDDRIFYVGKGKEDRCFSHISEARRTTKDSMGDYEKLATIREIEGSGHDVRIEVLRHGLMEAEAFHVEAAAMDLLGISNLAILKAGHGTEAYGRMSVDDVNALYCARPVEFDPDHRVILIRSRRFTHGMKHEDMYKTTRMWWRLGSRREGAEYAMAVYGGVVRAVYKIEEWIKPTEADIAKVPTRDGRYGFVGHRDTEMEKRYIFADVTEYVPERGGRNPIRYVNC
ncbi:MAG: hypothetical protein P1T08_17840 [Acidimicrobiia bacterium]|nr:hypothetical protein [Acidimicrobiia bacterium]